MELALPRFSTSFKADELAGSFQRRGMWLPFDPSAADFSGISGRPRGERPLYLQRVLHSAMINVTEQGTEAAAATAAEMRLISAPLQPELELFRVDKPFQFFIHDSSSGVIFFQGRINDPRK